MNPHLENRLKAIQRILMAHFEGGAGLANAMIGREREFIASEFFSKVLPPVFRFGSGTITDSSGIQSGQVDIVMELPFSPSFPMPGGSERLYVAESVAAVVEVKSNLGSQWSQLEQTVQKVKRLKRNLWQSSSLSLQSSAEPEPGFEPGDRIPCYAVGFTGFTSVEGLAQRLSMTEQSCRPDGALVIESGSFIGVSSRSEGPWGLYGFVADLIAHTNAALQIAYPNIRAYGPYEPTKASSESSV